MDSYVSQKVLEKQIVAEPTPASSNDKILNTLKLLDQISKIEKESPNPALKKIAAEEMSYLNGAMKAISEHPAIQQQFGSGIAGVEAVAGLLKQRNNELAYQSILDTVLEGSGSIKKFNDLAAAANRSIK